MMVIDGDWQKAEKNLTDLKAEAHFSLADLARKQNRTHAFHRRLSPRSV